MEKCQCSIYDFASKRRKEFNLPWKILYSQVFYQLLVIVVNTFFHSHYLYALLCWILEWLLVFIYFNQLPQILHNSMVY